MSTSDDFEPINSRYASVMPEDPVYLVSAALGHVERCVERLIEENMKLRADRERIAKLLADFWQAPISISSVQPLMELARELNPHLR